MWLALLGLAGGDKKLSDRLTVAVRRLAAEAGKVNMRVIMLPQRAEANELGGGLLRGQFAYRLTLPVDNIEAVRLLHPTVPHRSLRHTLPMGNLELRFTGPSDELLSSQATPSLSRSNAGR